MCKYNQFFAFYMEWILQELSFHLLVEHIVLHIGSHAVGEQELVVLFTAIA